MLQVVKTYLKFLLKSTNQHGVHSPFVFELVTKCFYDKKKYTEYNLLKNHRKKLLENKESIEITDFGAGSKIFKSNLRAINKMAKNSGISPKRSRLLFRLVKYFKPSNILELGTHLGLSTVALHLGHTDASVVTVEGCENTLNVAKHEFEASFGKGVTFINSDFDTYLKNTDFSYLKENKNHWNLVYFDGNHSKEATERYVEHLLSTVTNQTLWVFDDIHWNKEMEETWENIRKRPEVTVTIDTFQWGIVFFRKEQVKEHFTLRV